jgi:hypothetical protein
MKKIQDQSLKNSTDQLQDMITAQRARRTVLKGAVAGIASLSALGTNALVGSGNVFAHDKPHQDNPHQDKSHQDNPHQDKSHQDKSHQNKSHQHKHKLQQILDIAVTAEQLAVTTYSNGLAHAWALGIKGDNLHYLHAALVEEQIHESFFESLGGEALTSTFSYPNGAATFSNLATFIDTQQMLESSLDSAFLAGVIEAAQAGEFRLAQILAQIACIEAEHRVLGRTIIGYQPADNYAYTPVLVKRVKDTPSVLMDAGYLSPTFGNIYAYEPIIINLPDIEYRTPYSVGYPKH